MTSLCVRTQLCSIAATIGAVLRDRVFLVVGEDLKDQTFHTLFGWCLGTGDPPTPFPRPQMRDWQATVRVDPPKAEMLMLYRVTQRNLIGARPRLIAIVALSTGSDARFDSHSGASPHGIALKGASDLFDRPPPTRGNNPNPRAIRMIDESVRAYVMCNLCNVHFCRWQPLQRVRQVLRPYTPSRTVTKLYNIAGIMALDQH
jgi:hypothetical protein